jgi:hypothetical protein
VLIGQQLALNLRRALKILLKPTAFSSGEVVEAVANEPVGDRASSWDRLIAERSPGIRAGAHRPDQLNVMYVAWSVKVSLYHGLSLSHLIKR